jgi:threonine aldolase
MALVLRARASAAGWRHNPRHFSSTATAAAASGLAPGHRGSCCFASDNTRGALPEVLAAVAEANAPASVPSYGADTLSARASTAVVDFLGCHPGAAVLPAVSGIASDALGLTPYAQPCSAVIAHEVSHVNLWQCGAVGFYTGAMLETIGGDHGKINPALLEQMLSQRSSSAAYSPSLEVVSVTQPTEAGTLYSLEELREICSIAHAHGVSVHMDGARLTNAVVALGCTPAEVTWEAGVDVVCLGTTKGARLPTANSSRCLVSDQCSLNL